MTTNLTIEATIAANAQSETGKSCGCTSNASTCACKCGDNCQCGDECKCGTGCSCKK